MPTLAQALRENTPASALVSALAFMEKNKKEASWKASLAYDRQSKQWYAWFVDAESGKFQGSIETGGTPTLAAQHLITYLNLPD